MTRDLYSSLWAFIFDNYSHHHHRRYRKLCRSAVNDIVWYVQMTGCTLLRWGDGSDVSKCALLGVSNLEFFSEQCSEHGICFSLRSLHTTQRPYDDLIKEMLMYYMSHVFCDWCVFRDFWISDLMGPYMSLILVLSFLD